MPDIWFTILRWTILAAAVGLVVGTPVVYFNHRIDQAYSQGKVDGKSECEVVHAVAAQKAANDAMDLLQAEANKALAAQALADTNAKKAKDLKAKLDEALKTPLGVDCTISESATDILRRAGTGSFDTDKQGNPLSVPFPTGVQRGS